MERFGRRQFQHRLDVGSLAVGQYLFEDLNAIRNQVGVTVQPIYLRGESNQRALPFSRWSENTILLTKDNRKHA